MLCQKNKKDSKCRRLQLVWKGQALRVLKENLHPQGVVFSLKTLSVHFPPPVEWLSFFFVFFFVKKFCEGDFGSQLKFSENDKIHSQNLQTISRNWKATFLHSEQRDEQRKATKTTLSELLHFDSTHRGSQRAVILVMFWTMACKILSLLFKRFSYPIHHKKRP